MIFIVYYPTYTFHFAETLLNMQYRRNIGDIIIPPLLKSTLKNPRPSPQIPFPHPEKRTPPPPFYHVCFEGIYLNQKVFMELFLFLFYFESVP